MKYKISIILIFFSCFLFSQNQKLIGTWEGSGETIQLNAKTINYYGKLYSYSCTSNVITIQTDQGEAQFEYIVDGKYLTLKSNGETAIYVKTSNKNQQTETPQGNIKNNSGSVDQSLVGKWCYVNVNSTNSGGSSTSECITLYANGTYEYYSESSMSVNTNEYAGGTNNQSSDSGTWRVAGNTIIANSKTQGTKTYSLQKVNHPKNGDPMIVIDGRAYATYYQKKPW
ncbi:MAG: hypothetical protein LCH32_12460 [Bacteroidetes bacterium]|nr:hypothetical protein [Bacteroidota bacterium]